jgi:class 3 adenylate cyclase
MGAVARGATTESLRRRLKKAARSRKELERRIFHLKTLYDLSREIGPLIDVPGIMSNLLMMCIGTLGTERGIILVLNTIHNTIEAVTQRGLDAGEMRVLSEAVEAGSFKEIREVRGIRMFAGRGRARLGRDHKLLEVLAGLRLHVWSPFQVNATLAGGLALGGKLSGDAYSLHDQELLATLTNHGAVALQNAVTHQDVVRYAAELEASLRRIRLLEQIKANLAKFVPLTVRELIEESPEAPSFDKREMDVSVLFADITGYTRVSAEMELEKVNRLVERYFSAFLDEILGRGGDVNETAGDGLMVIFRKQEPRRHARAAMLAALGIQRRTREISSELEDPSQAITMKVAVNSGIASVGATKIEGAAGTRWTYTASGPTTNIAARLAALAEGGTVVISEETRRRLGDEFEFEDLGPQSLKNVAQPLRAFRAIDQQV